MGLYLKTFEGERLITPDKGLQKPLQSSLKHPPDQPNGKQARSPAQCAPEEGSPPLTPLHP